MNLTGHPAEIRFTLHVKNPGEEEKTYDMVGYMNCEPPVATTQPTQPAEKEETHGCNSLDSGT